jgi:aspartyl-tRNA synthetase
MEVKYLSDLDFCVETPYLIKTQKEHVMLFSRMNEALPQSPQTFKQLLMGGMDNNRKMFP